ncbi:MAG: riboflavin synthase [Patescibacteria group bacterium]|jgi:riboflavin synthase|nr:riboflavin synthase [Patescibacteria group bacterium]
MFSGIIEQTSSIVSRNGGIFTVENKFNEPLSIGQSIAHDGACMTITGINSDSYVFFVMQESLARTNF